MAIGDPPLTHRLPVEAPDTKPFWDACREGRLIVQRCSRCGEHQYPFRGICSFCWLTDVAPETVESSGRGSLWTYSVIYQNDTAGFEDDLPYVSAVVELEEGGLRIMTNVINCAPEDVSVGMPVQLVFIEREGWSLPMFEPEREAG